MSTGPAAATPPSTTAITLTTFTTVTRTVPTTTTTTSGRWNTSPTPAMPTCTARDAVMRPWPTAITSTTCTTDTATLGTKVITTSIDADIGPGRNVMSSAEFEDPLHEVAEARLRLIEQRYTAGRRAIVEILRDAGHPVSIGDIGDRLPDLPRSSAYRHLTDLQA